MTGVEISGGVVVKRTGEIVGVRVIDGVWFLEYDDGDMQYISPLDVNIINMRLPITSCSGYAAKGDIVDVTFTFDMVQ